MSISNITDKYQIAKEYENAISNIKKFNGNIDLAAPWFEELCTIVVRFRLDKSRLNMLLMQKLELQAKVWYTSQQREITGYNLDDDTIVPVILSMIKMNFLGVHQQNEFDLRIRNMKLRSTSLTKSDLEQHYTSFVQLMNNILLCDSNIPEYQYVVLYKQSLPLPILQLIGDIDNMKNISIIQNAAVSAVNKIQMNIVSMDRIRVPINSMYVNDQSQYEYENTDYLHQQHINVMKNRSFSSRNRERSKSPSKSHSSLIIYSSIKCWHCGLIGHGVVNCPIAIAKKPQTPEGIKVYGKYCSDHDIDRPYNSKKIFQKFSEKQKEFLKKQENNKNNDSDYDDLSENEVVVVDSEDESNNASSARSNSPYPKSSRRK